MLNQCQFIGRLGKQPEIKTMQNGNKVCNFSIAVDDSYKNKEGQKVDRAQWVNVVIYTPSTVLFCENYLDKGDLIFLSGKMVTRSYESNGETKYVTEVVVQEYAHKVQKLSYSNEKPSQNTMHDDLEDDIPF